MRKARYFYVSVTNINQFISNKFLKHTYLIMNLHLPLKLTEFNAKNVFFNHYTIKILPNFIFLQVGFESINQLRYLCQKN